MKKMMVWMALILSISAAGVLGSGCSGSKRQGGEMPAQMSRLPGEKPEPMAKTAPAVTQPRDGVREADARTGPGLSEHAKQGTDPRKGALDEAPPAPQGSWKSTAPAAKDPPTPGPPRAPRTLSAGASDKGTTGPEADDQKIVFNFDDADLYEVIKALGDLMQISYLVDPGIQGKVTIHTADGLRKKDLFPLFFQILEANGLTAVKEGPVYKVFVAKEASRMPLSGDPGMVRKGAPSGERVIIEIIPLKYISAVEVTKLLTPFLSAAGMIVPDDGSSTVVVVDSSPNISKILELVKVFDVNIFERLNYRFYPLVNVNAVEASKVLNDVFAAHGKASLNYAKFIGIEKINTVLVLSANPHLFMKIDQMVRELDDVDNSMTRRIYVYFVKNGSAADFGDILGKALEGDTETESTKTSSKKKEPGGMTQLSGNPFSKARVEEKKAEKAAEAEGTPKADKSAPVAQPQQTAAKTTTISQGEGGGANSLKSDVKITVDEIRNALVIEAIPVDYQVIMALLKQLDRLPRQVLIEATIAEISREASMELGMDWALGAGAALGAASFAASVGGGGLKYSIGVTNKWYAELQALASKNKVNVLSSPHVLASDNKEARIDVSREIPVASSQTMYGTATAVTETAIEYRDTGVILIVTPHINDHGMVTMDIEEEVSDLEKNPILVAGKEYPAFFKRTINTTLTVKDGQTIAIGGLIKDKEDTLISGVPCLIDIPVVRYLFGNYSENTEKNELIVLITPRVIDDLNDVDQVTHEFKSKVINVVDKYFR